MSASVEQRVYPCGRIAEVCRAWSASGTDPGGACRKGRPEKLNWLLAAVLGALYAMAWMEDVTRGESIRGQAQTMRAVLREDRTHCLRLFCARTARIVCACVQNQVTLIVGHA